MKTLLISLTIIFSATIISFNTNSNYVYNQDKWVAPASAKEISNPFAGEESIAKGQSIYQTRCTVCHGPKGEGDGPAGKSLTPPAANQSTTAVQSQTDGELFWKISEGRGPMVGWKLILSEEERWALVNYMRTLAK